MLKRIAVLVAVVVGCGLWVVGCSSKPNAPVEDFGKCKGVRRWAFDYKTGQVGAYLRDDRMHLVTAAGDSVVNPQHGRQRGFVFAQIGQRDSADVVEERWCKMSAQQ